MPLALRRMWIQVTADRKRFGMLVGVVVVGVLLWARIIVVSQPPRRAVAADDTPSLASVDRGGGDQGSREGSGIEPQQAVEIELDRELVRDPFLINPTLFPRPILDDGSSTVTPKSSESSVEDAQREAEQRREALAKQADRMRLGAVMRSAQLAVINNETYRVGDALTVQGGKDTFTLVQVDDRSVIVECQGERFEIRIPSGE
jgi:hypothetical protein